MADTPLDRVRDLFDRATAVPAGERGRLLDEACAGDAALRAEVETLLRADAALGPDDETGPFHSPLVRCPGPARPVPGGAPEWVGPYRVIRLIAAGGMGAVYEAEQDHPRRRVALKIVHPGVTSPDLFRRCGTEAEILGRLHHPGIPQVYAAGEVPDGRPYFAMEFVPGRHLDEYARRAGLTVPARIELLARVCDAVHHAHEHGIVHRDLKPANVLVDATGQPKVLDFGVARVAAADRLTRADRTRTGQLVGTLTYMSPEQLDGPSGTLDRRADVYALGVILFELLAGRPPYSLDGGSFAEAARVIRDVDPRLGADRPDLRGDPETIVARAMEKDPRRRYQSAAELAADLRRHLAHEPIVARPPSALYQFRKFARRNSALVAGAAATGAALVLRLAGILLFAFGEARQRVLAEQHEREALAAKRESEYQTYRARIAAAAAALATHDVEEAGRQLAAAPADLRGWEWHHLSSRLDDSSSVTPLPHATGAFLTGGPDPLRVGAWTPDGLRLTDLESGSHRTVPVDPGRGYRVSAAETHLGLRIAVWVGDTTFELLDDAGTALCRVELPRAKQWAPIAVSRDGTRMATHWEDGEERRIVVFDATSGKQTAVCDGHRHGIWALAFSPDSTRLASASEDQTARVWDPTTGAQLAVCRGHTRKVLGVAFRPDGRRLATASSDGTVRQWDAATGHEAEAPYDRHSGEVAAVAYSPDGQLVASAGTDRTVRVWEAAGRQDVSVLHGHAGPVVRLAFSPQGRRLASLSLTWIFSRGEDAVRVWDVSSPGAGSVLKGHTQPVYPVAFSPDGRRVASGSWDGTVRLWDFASGAPRATLPHPGVVPALAYGPDGSWLVTGTYGDDRLRVWDAAAARVRKEIPGPPGVIRFVALSPEGERVAATAYDGQKHVFQVRDVGTGDRLYAADGRALAYSPDGRWLAALAADERTVLLLDARTHEPAARLIGHEGAVHRGVFSPDGRHLATCGADRTVRLWPVGGGDCRVLRGHTDEVFAVAFHPDGSRLATAGRDRVIWLWNLARGEDVARLPGHTGYVWSLAFSPDGAVLASGSGDSTVRLWDTAAHGTRSRASAAAEKGL